MGQIIFQRAKCIGCNACVEAAPERWRISTKDGRCSLVGGVENKGFYKMNIPETELDKNKLAAANCPVKIIQIRN